MKKTLLLLLFTSLLITSCGTINGGSNYYAKVIVNNNPNAKIIYKGQEMGMGEAIIKVKRSEANKFSFTVNEEGGKDQVFQFKERKFRGWSFTGSLLLSPTVYFIPLGLVLDFATASLWKPNIEEKGVSKQDYKHFNYNVNYTEKQAKITPEQILFTDVIYLKSGNIIKGTIIEQLPNEYIKVQTSDQKIDIYPISEIEKMKKEAIQ